MYVCFCMYVCMHVCMYVCTQYTLRRSVKRLPAYIGYMYAGNEPLYAQRLLLRWSNIAFAWSSNMRVCMTGKFGPFVQHKSSTHEFKHVRL